MCVCVGGEVGRRQREEGPSLPSWRCSDPRDEGQPHAPPPEAPDCPVRPAAAPLSHNQQSASLCRGSTVSRLTL